MKWLIFFALTMVSTTAFSKLDEDACENPNQRINSLIEYFKDTPSKGPIIIGELIERGKNVYIKIDSAWGDHKNNVIEESAFLPNREKVITYRGGMMGGDGCPLDYSVKIGDRVIVFGYRKNSAVDLSNIYFPYFVLNKKKIKEIGSKKIVEELSETIIRKKLDSAFKN